MRTLQTSEISKSYRGRKVVDNVSLWVKQGEVVGLLGPNGAGKTTSFYIIVGLISPDSGSVWGLPKTPPLLPGRPAMTPEDDSTRWFAGRVLSPIRRFVHSLITAISIRFAPG